MTRPACRLAALALVAAAVPAAAADEADLARDVRAAQARFEAGVARLAEGRRRDGQAEIDAAYRMLIEAQIRGGPKHAAVFERLLARFFAELAAADPTTARAGESYATQAARSFPSEETPASLPGEVESYVRYYSREKREFLARSFDRSLRWIPMIHEVFAREGLPVDLAYMALIESSFLPGATSRAGARGLWQFMPATARRFGLEVRRDRDDRLDPERATVAAAAYLKELHRRFGNWPLAVAAYNCGEGCVGRALRRAPGARTFWDLAARGALPFETRAYVPSIVAVTIIARDPERHGLAGRSAGGPAAPR